MTGTIIPFRRPRARNHLDALPALWNSSADNPVVIERQRHSEELTSFQIEHDPNYAAELARLRSWIGSYEIPTIQETP